MTLQWKQHDVLKTSGCVVKVGEYQGANFDEKGKPVPSKFGAFDIRRMHDNATEPIPIFVDLHGKGLARRVPVGYAFRVGLNADGTELAHNGFVYDTNARMMIAKGHNMVSPEITTVKDANGNIIDRRIDALCYVPSGAIEGTELNYMVEKFSTPEGLNTNTGTQDSAGTTAPAFDANAIVAATAKAVIEAMTPMTKQMIDDAVSKVGQNTQGAEVSQPATPTTPPVVDSAMQAELDKLKSQSAAQQQFTDQLINEKYEDIVAQVKKLGIPDPSSIVAGIPKQKAIEMLTSVRANLIQNATLNGVPQGLSSQGTGQKSEAMVFDECMSELGFNSEHYRDMFK